MTAKVAPTRIRLEASSHCQLRCPSCPTTTKAIDAAVGKGFLKAADFRKLVDENPSLTHIELSNYGEIFLNPDMLEIMAYGHERGVKLLAGNGVNLNNVRDDVLEGLVKYRFGFMTCSIDGASAETYAKYRVRGSFDKVLANIKKINEFKKQYKSDLPTLVWQFIVFGYNEHEILDAKKMADSLNMTFVPKLSWDDDFSSIRNKELVGQLNGLGVSTRDEFEEKYGRPYMQSICHQLWINPQINWDGKNLGCCRNFWGDFGGNAFTDGLMNVVNNEKIGHARGMLLGEQPARDDIPCTTCEIYISMKASGRFLKVTAKPAK